MARRWPYLTLGAALGALVATAGAGGTAGRWTVTVALAVAAAVGAVAAARDVAARRSRLRRARPGRAEGEALVAQLDAWLAAGAPEDPQR